MQGLASAWPLMLLRVVACHVNANKFIIDLNTDSLLVLQRVDLGDCRQSEAKFRYQAISGTCSASNFTGDLFSVRPKAEIKRLAKTQHSEGFSCHYSSMI
jgi:hypothetical protein